MITCIWRVFFSQCWWLRNTPSAFSQIKPVLQSSKSFAKTLFYPLIPHQRHPQAPVPSLPLRRWYDPKARRFVCLGKENILWGQVKQDVLECGPSLLLALCNNALSGANVHTHAHTHRHVRTRARVHIHFWNAIPNNHKLSFVKCLSDSLSSCIYLKRGVCD